MKADQCKQMVWHGRHDYQCSRKSWKDGYCKQHHPDIKKEGDDKRRRERMAKIERERERSPRHQLGKANEKLAAFAEREKIIAEVYERFKDGLDCEPVKAALFMWQTIKRFMEASNADH